MSGSNAIEEEELAEVRERLDRELKSNKKFYYGLAAGAAIGVTVVGAACFFPTMTVNLVNNAAVIVNAVKPVAQVVLKEVVVEAVKAVAVKTVKAVAQAVPEAVAQALPDAVVVKAVPVAVVVKAVKAVAQIVQGAVVLTAGFRALLGVFRS